MAPKFASLIEDTSQRARLHRNSSVISSVAVYVFGAISGIFTPRKCHLTWLRVYRLLRIYHPNMNDEGFFFIEVSKLSLKNFATLSRELSDEKYCAVNG